MLAAIAILGTLLVGIVLAKSRLTGQVARTRQVERAVRLTDALISRWWADPDRGVPVGASGTFGPEGSLTWRTERVANRPIDELGAQVVRVSVRQADTPAGSDASAEPLLAVDLVLREELDDDPNAAARTIDLYGQGGAR